MPKEMHPSIFASWKDERDGLRNTLFDFYISFLSVSDKTIPVSCEFGEVFEDSSGFWLACWEGGMSSVKECAQKADVANEEDQVGWGKKYLKQGFNVWVAKHSM